MISAPDNYGLTPEQTLAYRADQSLPAAFEEYWRSLRDEVAALPSRWHGTLDAPVNQVLIRSQGEIRLVASVVMPDAAVSGVVVNVHGYTDVPAEIPGPEDCERWTTLGLAVVRLRLRGYPPSTMDLGDLRGAWILHGVETSATWIVRGAAADVIQCVRCAQSAFPNLPLFLHGESLGAGLAIIAAAQLECLGIAPHRLVLELPCLGDWRWRALRYCNGAGGQINVLMDALRGCQRENLLQTLLMCDAALHAPGVRTPALVKLAVQDDTVPAPSAATIFNALGSHRRWRFVTQFGHFDGGLRDTRRHALFERVMDRFVNPDVSPEEAVQPHLDALE